MWHSPNASSGHSCLICLPPSRLPPLSAYLPPPAARPPAECAYYIVAVSGGTVLSKQPDGIHSLEAWNSDSQRWRVEYAGSGLENHVAIKNVSDSKWLRALTGDSNGEVVTADEKQWWTVEEGPSPGSCWLKCNDLEDAYLGIMNGSHSNKGAVHAGPKKAESAPAFTWYLRDADAVGYDSKGWQLSTGAKSGLEVAKVHQSSREMEEREKALEVKQSSILKKENLLAAQEHDLQQRIDQLAGKEADLQQRLQMSSGSSNNTDIALLKTENDNLHIQLRTSSLEREVEKIKERVVSSKHAEQRRILEAETGRLKAIIHAHERSARSSPSPTKSREPESVFTSPSPNATRPNGNLTSPSFDQNAFSLRSPPAQVARLGSRIPSLTATPALPRPLAFRDSPSTPTRPSTANSSLASGTMKSYDSRFSGWPEDDCPVPITPSKVSKRAISSPMGSTLSGSQDQSQSSAVKKGPPAAVPTGHYSAYSIASPAGLGISKSPSIALSLADSEPASRGTPRKEKLLAPSHRASPSDKPHLSEDGDAVVHPCGHKIYKPPRKLNKTVTGYLYE